ncbi:hypothetical protein ACP275_04G127300 [Erythranthe tilingii]
MAFSSMIRLALSPKLDVRDPKVAGGGYPIRLTSQMISSPNKGNNLFFVCSTSSLPPWLTVPLTLEETTKKRNYNNLYSLADNQVRSMNINARKKENEEGYNLNWRKSPNWKAIREVKRAEHKARRKVYNENKKIQKEQQEEENNDGDNEEVERDEDNQKKK